MKKIAYLSMLMIAILFSNCKKESPQQEEEEEQNGPKPVPVQIITTDANNVTSTSVYEYDNNRNVTKITTTGTNTEIKNFYYHDASKGLLDSIVKTKNGNFEGISIYTINNDKISKYDVYNSGRALVSTYTITHYDGNNPDRIILTKLIQGNFYDFNVEITYTDGNVSQAIADADLQGNNYHSVSTFTLDDKNNIYKNVNTNLNDEFLIEKNNNLTERYELSYFGNTMVSNADYTYTYNSDDFPTQVVKTVGGSYMEGLSNLSMNITYEDK